MRMAPDQGELDREAAAWSRVELVADAYSALCRAPRVQAPVWVSGTYAYHRVQRSPISAAYRAEGERIGISGCRHDPGGEEARRHGGGGVPIEA